VGIIRPVAKIIKPADTTEDTAAHLVEIITATTTTAVAGAVTTGTDDVLPASMLALSVAGVGRLVCLAKDQSRIQSA
jgi:hypothetical protein